MQVRLITLMWDIKMKQSHSHSLSLCLPTDVFHWECVDAYARNFPPNTAPAGYTCPSCNTSIFPSSNMISPVAETLRKYLASVNWARAGLGLSLVSLKSFYYWYGIVICVKALIFTCLLPCPNQKFKCFDTFQIFHIFNVIWFVNIFKKFSVVLRFILMYMQMWRHSQQFLSLFFGGDNL